MCVCVCVTSVKALAIDEAANNVRVNIVSPGNVWTPMWKEAVDAAPDPLKCYQDGANAQLLGRMGTVREAHIAGYVSSFFF